MDCSYTDHMVCGWIEARRHGWKYESQRAAIDWFLAKAWDYWKIKGGLVGFLTEWLSGFLGGF